MKHPQILTGRRILCALAAAFILPVCCSLAASRYPGGPGQAWAQEPEPADKTLSPYFFVKSDDPGIDQLPLKSTSVVVNISAFIADVAVTQVYRNDGSKPVEAMYVFPASTRAAVYGMKMTIGERTVTARIGKRQEAREAYEKARQEGRSASLLEQDRPNVFLMNVANILPGDEVETELRYTEILVPTDGVYEFVYPTVVGPRYSNQPAAMAPASEKWSMNPYLHQGESPTCSFDIKARVTAGVPIGEMSCPSHKAAIAYRDKSAADIDLDPGEHSGGNRDFILRYRLAGDRIESGLLLYEGSEENFFLLMGQPPKRVTPDSMPPREYIFIVDVSGSMHGFPLEISKKLVKDLLTGLRPTDLFNIMTFSGGSDLLSERSVAASADNIRLAIEMIQRPQGAGGTELLPAMRRAFSLPRTEKFARTIVIATDGYVTVEPEVFDLIRQLNGDANIFPFGIGTSVNRHIIEGMARIGSGEPFVVTRADEAPGMAEKFRKYVQSPVLTQIKVNFGDFQAYEVTPSGVSDIFAERPAVVFGKWKGKPQGTITISGLNGREKYEKRIDVAEIKPLAENSALRYLWARTLMTQLSDYNNLKASDERVKEITELGIRYNLLSAYTSFVAIDTRVRRQGEDAVTVKQPLPLPQGVSDNALAETQACIPAMAATSPGRYGYSGPADSFKTKSESLGGSYRIAEAKIGSAQDQARKAGGSGQEATDRTGDMESGPDEGAHRAEFVIERLTVRGGLSKEAVRQAVEQNLPLLRQCFGGNIPRFGLSMEWTIDRTGSVVNVRVLSNKGMDKMVLDCIGGQIGRWSFPAPKDGGKVNVTVTMSAANS